MGKLFQLFDSGDVYNEGVVLGTAFGRKDAGDRIRVQGVGRKAIDSLGGQAHHLSLPQQGGCQLDILRAGRQQFGIQSVVPLSFYASCYGFSWAARISA